MAVIVGNTLTDLAQADLQNDLNFANRRKLERDFLTAIASLANQRQMGRERNAVEREGLSSRERIAGEDRRSSDRRFEIGDSTTRRGQDINERINRDRNTLLGESNRLKAALDELDRVQEALDKTRYRDIQEEKNKIDRDKLNADLKAEQDAAALEQAIMDQEAEQAASVGNVLLGDILRNEPKRGFIGFRSRPMNEAFTVANPDAEQQALRQSALVQALQALDAEQRGLVQLGQTNLVPRRFGQPSMAFGLPVNPALTNSPATNVPLVSTNRPRYRIIAR